VAPGRKFSTDSPLQQLDKLLHVHKFQVNPSQPLYCNKRCNV